MFKNFIFRNVVLGLVIILLGVLSISVCDYDGTFFIFALFMGICVVFSKEDVIDYPYEE